MHLAHRNVYPTDIKKLEQIVKELPRVPHAYGTENRRNLELRYLVDFIIAQDMKRNKEILPEDEPHRESLLNQKRNQCLANIAQDPSCFYDLSFWINYMHVKGTSAQGIVRIYKRFNFARNCK